jgi:two-component system NtrC family sensor kinase
MPEGGSLHLLTRDVDGGAELQVIDSGPGLSEATRERLFRPFFTTRNDGNGLGLWISQGLVERYGGHITAANRGDGTSGAVFTVHLFTEPRAPEAASTNDGRPGAQ